MTAALPAAANEALARPVARPLGGLAEGGAHVAKAVAHDHALGPRVPAPPAAEDPAIDRVDGVDHDVEGLLDGGHGLERVADGSEYAEHHEREHRAHQGAAAPACDIQVQESAARHRTALQG